MGPIDAGRSEKEVSVVFQRNEPLFRARAFSNALVDKNISRKRDAARPRRLDGIAGFDR